MPLSAQKSLAAVFAIVLSACGPNETRDSFDDAHCQAALNSPDSLDAFDWFKNPSGGPKRLGSLSTDQGLALAHELENRGATRVVAGYVRSVPTPEPHQLADGLVVSLPDDPVKRHSLFQLYAQQLRASGIVPRADSGQKYLFLTAKP